MQQRLASGFRFSKALKCVLNFNCIQCPLGDSGKYLLQVTHLVKGFAELEPQPPASAYSAAGKLCRSDSSSHVTALPSADRSCSPLCLRIRIVQLKGPTKIESHLHSTDFFPKVQSEPPLYFVRLYSVSAWPPRVPPP